MNASVKLEDQELLDFHIALEPKIKAWSENKLVGITYFGGILHIRSGPQTYFFKKQEG